MKKAVVLVNLGTPRSPGYLDMFCYLAQFLGDKRVVDLNRLLWLPLLYLVVLPVRAYKSGKVYAQIWNARTGSPLRHHTEALTAALAKKLKGIQTVYAMRYGKPYIGTTLTALANQGYTHVTVLPLYPQYAGATTGTAEDVVRAWQRQNPKTKITVTPPWHSHPAYINALAQSITKATKGKKIQKIIVSFHGIPKRYVTQGDPYQAHCEATFKLLQKKLPRQNLLLTYQSIFGREEWLQPYTEPTLTGLPAKGIQHIAVVAPGFVCDCVETLEELGLRGREAFLHAGGKSYTLIPCLNAAAAPVLEKLL